MGVPIHMRAVTLEARIDELVALYGSLRALARALGCDSGYLSRLRSGERGEPSKTILQGLGLERHVIYTRLPT